MFTTKSEVKYKDSVPYRPGMLSCGILWIKREELIYLRLIARNTIRGF